MKALLVIVAAVVGVSLGYVGTNEAAPFVCRTGEVQGFATVRWSPAEIVGQIPSGRFAQRPKFFWRKYNCTGANVMVRRRDVGVYEIAFPGLGYRMAVVSAVTQDGTNASVQPLGTGVFRVILRGPVVNDGLLARRDVAFAIVVL